MLCEILEERPNTMLKLLKIHVSVPLDDLSTAEGVLMIRTVSMVFEILDNTHTRLLCSFASQKRFVLTKKCIISVQRGPKVASWMH